MSERSLGVVVVAGSRKEGKKEKKRRRRHLYTRMLHPRLWKTNRSEFEVRFASRINRDDYIIGENKSLLYLHPDLVNVNNLNFLKRVLYFSGKSGDRFYRKRKKALLEYLSRGGITPVTLIVKALLENEYVDPGMIVIVGPRKQLLYELERNGLGSTQVVHHGSSLGENIQKGKEHLLSAGYRGEYMLVQGGDVPLVTAESLQMFMESVRDRGRSPDLYYGVGSRRELGDFIREHGAESQGRVGPNYPRKGYLNKFGVRILDDIGIFGRGNARDIAMVGNVFLYKTSSVNCEFIDRFYSMRKMFANPFVIPRLVKDFGLLLFRSGRWKLRLTDAEEFFRRSMKVDLRFAYAPSECVLDMDSYSDLRRLSALHFNKMGSSHDLEVDFRRYLRKKIKRERRRRRLEIAERRRRKKSIKVRDKGKGHKMKRDGDDAGDRRG